MTSPAIAIAYIRVSTEEQATTGASLAAQEASVRAYCAMRGFTLADVVTDAGVSAGVPLAERPGGARVLAALRSRAAGAPRHVVAVKLDRLFRNVVDCVGTAQEWDRRGVSLHLVDLGGQTVDTSSAMGRFMLAVLGAAGELERGLTAERTSSAMRQRLAEGRYIGGRAPYGLQNIDGDLVPCPAEQAVIAEARALRSAGLTLRAVAAELAGRGHLSRHGTPFVPAAVNAMVAA
jgi:DNA invertase Pin-like site-specific DNA recombinase